MASRRFPSPLETYRKIRNSQSEDVLVALANPHLVDALSENKRQGQKLAIQARWVALTVVGIMLPFLITNWSVLYYEAILIGFDLLGWAQLRAGRVGHSHWELFLLFCDLLLMTIVILVPNPFSEADWPTAMQYRFDNFAYFYVILAGATLAYSWRTLLALGTWLTGIWIAGLLVVIYFGKQMPELTQKMAAALADHPLLVQFLDPNNTVVSFRSQEMVIFLIVASILALNGWRNNQLLLRQAEMARERGNLARHFPPGIVEQIARQDNPFQQVRSQSVAVMFADIVGFTHMAERDSPENVVGLLRAYHQLMESAVFNNHGTLDKFLGDGIMASFGTPEPGPEDAANALRCAREMLDSVDKWNVARREQGKAAVKLSVGIHYGDVILGDIGSRRRLEFATLGDTVNVASRLEELTRSLDTQLIVSDSLVKAAGAAMPVGNGFAAMDIVPAGQKILRGRDQEIVIWKLAASLKQ